MDADIVEGCGLLVPADESFEGMTSKDVHNQEQHHTCSPSSPHHTGEGSWDEHKRDHEISSKSCGENLLGSHVPDGHTNTNIDNNGSESRRRQPFQSWLRRPLDDARANNNSSPARKNSPRLSGTDGSPLRGKISFLLVYEDLGLQKILSLWLSRLA